MSATLRLPPLTSSVPEARRFVTRQLEQWGLDALVDTVALLTSEIVSNAVLHARSEIVVTATDLGDGAVQVDVADLSSVSPVQRRHSDEATTGRGIQLLDQLARSWEVLPTDGGKTVRFTVDSSSDPWASFLDDAWLDAEL